MSEAASHFEGKDPIKHVVEKQSQGILTSVETHGAEAPGHISAAADSAREMAVLLMLLYLALSHLGIENRVTLLATFISGIALVIWRLGRSAWLGWARLERLHRVMEEERRVAILVEPERILGVSP